MIKCCKGCSKRKVGCHSTCGTYHLEKSEHEAKREEDKRKREIFYGVSEQAIVKSSSVQSAERG